MKLDHKTTLEMRYGYTLSHQELIVAERLEKKACTGAEVCRVMGLSCGDRIIKAVKNAKQN